MILEKKSTEVFFKLGIAMAIIVIINILAASFYFRLDLTEEKRYTIKKPTKNLLADLDDVVYVEVYLAGDLNPRFKRFQKAIHELLKEFEHHSGGRVQYSFYDPAMASGAKARNEFMQALANKGIQPTNIIEEQEGQRSEKIVFPGAIISYGGVETGLMLLKGSQGAGPDERLNQSIEGLEYEFAAAIRNLTSIERKKIGFVRGKGEPDSLRVSGLMDAMSESFLVRQVNLQNPISKAEIDILVLVKPTLSFTEVEKYHLDQFIISGGKALLLMDVLDAKMSLASEDDNLAFPYELNLQDLLFRYGLRINNNLIQDRQSGQYPVVVGFMGDQPQIRNMPWPFFPVISNYSKHPVVRNLNAVNTRFISTIDTVKATGIEKTPLMMTSPYTRVISAPVKVTVNDLRNMTPESFNQGPQIVGWLLEGNFQSLYKNRFAPEGVDTETFKEDGLPTSLIVISDGDVAVNEVNPRNGMPLPLGFDPFTNTTLANEDLIMNALNYLADDAGLILARTREVKIRPLDKARVDKDRIWWQAFNLVTPLVFILVFALLWYWLRKRKYAR